MASFSLRSRPRRHSAGARVFADEQGRLWSAAFATEADELAIVFTCITDARQPVSALALPDDVQPHELSDAVLRAWLTQAPRIGPLS